MEIPNNVDATAVAANSNHDGNAHTLVVEGVDDRGGGGGSGSGDNNDDDDSGDLGHLDAMDDGSSNVR